VKIAIHTLGCKVNQCDAKVLIAELIKRGYNAFSTHDFSQNADVFIINTCTVTHVSDKKSRQMIRRAKKQNPHALIAICGCMAKKSEKITEADYVFDARNPDDFLNKIEKINSIESLFVNSLKISMATKSDVDNKLRSVENKKSTRAFVKIQDGCDRFCSYCIVPHVRGAVTSRPLAEIIEETKLSIAEGVLEVVLTGIQVAAYGQDTGKLKLADVINEVTSLSGLRRLRLSSIDPWGVDDDFISAVASDLVCGHFHLSLQSGCDTTLAKMNRRYTTEAYKNAAERLRKIKPNTALTTDIIVGFPGETDADFAESIDFVKKMRFAKIHVFEYSPREGTPAAAFPDQVPHDIKHERGNQMRTLAAELHTDFLQAQIGKTLTVIVEKQRDGAFYVGNSENYCTVCVKSDKNLTGQICKVNITSSKGDFLHGNTKG